MNRTARCLILTLTGVAWAAPLDAAQDDQAARVAWLEAHAVRLRTVDPADTDFTDLAGFAEALGDARIVMLGEQTHGDGATFHAKTRLIEFLHQELGFDVLAFEGNFYGMREAWDRLRSGEDPLAAFRLGLGRVWTESSQVQPLIAYIGARAASASPLEVAGFDSQLRRSSREPLLEELEALAREFEPALVAGAPWVAARAALDSVFGGTYYAVPLSPVQHQRIRDWLTDLGQAMDPEGGGVPDIERAYMRQLLESIAAQSDAIAVWDPNDSQPFGNIRDEQMARNLIWLARNRYRGRKIIVWSATAHIMRNHRTIDRGQEDLVYDSVKVMGHDVWEALGEETYVVGFTAHGGSWGWYNGAPRELPAPPPGSIEDLLGRTTLDNAFLDFRHRDPGGDWLGGRLLMRPLGNRPMEADWTAVMDGVVFTRTMYPSTQASR